MIERVTVENLHVKPPPDNARNTPGKLPAADAGRLIADVFDGSPELDNLVSQATVLNRGAGSKWTKMERAWRKALTKEPLSAVTDIEIKVLYDRSKLSTGFDVQYNIDGEPATRDFSNPIPETD
nr:DNA/RNA non-specific endonuclease [Rathayibacter rathayi]